MSFENIKQELNNEKIKSAQACAVIEERSCLIEKRENELLKLRDQLAQLEKDHQAIEIAKTALERQIDQTSQEIEERNKKALGEFDLLARKILDEKTKTFDATSQKALEGLINPLKVDIKTFHQNIEKKYEADLRDRSALKQEIFSITDAGKKLQASSDSLAKALKGEAKARGRWGELVLERLLEGSGLRKGHEFTTEESYSNSEGGRLRPDVTVNLANQKKIFVDSKVSLNHYDSYIASSDDQSRSLALKALLTSFCERVKELSDKEYQAVVDVETLDFVLMFTPLESAFSLVIQSFEKNNEKSFFEYAWEKGVIITSPTTLMPILKTINLCWQAEYQNKNALQIAKEASLLYDKFNGFVKKLQDVGDSIEASRAVFLEAKNALSDGKGNLIRRTERIRLLLKKERKLANEYFEESELVEESDIAALPSPL